MSEVETTARSAQRLESPPGIALRCQLLLNALGDRGPLLPMELREELDHRLAAVPGVGRRRTPLADDLATLRAGGWVEPWRSDPLRLRLVIDPVAVEPSDSESGTGRRRS